MSIYRDYPERVRRSLRGGAPTLPKLAALLLASLLLLGGIAWAVLDSTQSRFVRAERGEWVILTEKSADRGYRSQGALRFIDEGVAWLRSATASAPLASDRRFTLILTAGGFGGIDIADPLFASRFSGTEGSARLPLHRYAEAIRGGELAFPVFASPDGAYAALDLGAGRTAPALVHALVHAGLAAAIPDAYRARLDPASPAFDLAESRRWRFLEESMALLLSELRALGEEPRAAAARFDEAAARYGDLGPVADEERLRLGLSGVGADEDAAYFRAAYGFSARLLAVAGIDATLSLAGRLLSGDYADLEDALASLPGGFGPEDMEAAFASRSD